MKKFGIDPLEQLKGIMRKELSLYEQMQKSVADAYKPMIDYDRLTAAMRLSRSKRRRTLPVTRKHRGNDSRLLKAWCSDSRLCAGDCDRREAGGNAGPRRAQ